MSVRPQRFAALVLSIALLASTGIATAAPEPPGATVAELRVTSHTNGAQLTITDKTHGFVILQPDRPERRAWHGKRVRATGDLCIYHCPPDAQCLTSGPIPFLRNVELQATP